MRSRKKPKIPIQALQENSWGLLIGTTSRRKWNCQKNQPWRQASQCHLMSLHFLTQKKRLQYPTGKQIDLQHWVKNKVVTKECNLDSSDPAINSSGKKLIPKDQRKKMLLRESSLMKRYSLKLKGLSSKSLKLSEAIAVIRNPKRGRLRICFRSYQHLLPTNRT